MGCTSMPPSWNGKMVMRWRRRQTALAIVHLLPSLCACAYRSSAFPDVEAALFGLSSPRIPSIPALPAGSQRHRARYRISGLYSARSPPSPFRPAPPPPHRSRGRAGGCEHQVRG
ncbi:hypothetical protein B0H13DRAFT_2084927 [Mycena leptocephala]|nr:hypothetical protein B0H13DRAFT_2084927 [Mycena leptocephala]